MVTIAIGFLGCGFIARYHAERLGNGGADARIVSAFDPDRHRAAAFTAAFGGAVAGDEAEVIGAVDAVYVTTWTSEHRRLAEAAARAGRAVFVEKPLATGLADAEAIAATVASAGVVNQVGLVLRDSPSFLLLRHLVQRPLSGRLMTVLFRDDQYLPVRGLYGSTWRADAERAGAGTLLEHSIHDLDLLTWIAGPAPEVSARTAGFHGIDGIEDLATVTLRHASGALATLTSVWHDILARSSLRHVEVFCERARYVLSGDVDGPVSWTVEEPGEDGLGPEGSVRGDDLRRLAGAFGLVARDPDAAFVEAVARGGPAYPAISEALPAHRLADAAYRSAGTGGVPMPVPSAPDHR